MKFWSYNWKRLKEKIEKNQVDENQGIAILRIWHIFHLSSSIWSFALLSWFTSKWDVVWLFSETISSAGKYRDSRLRALISLCFFLLLKRFGVNIPLSSSIWLFISLLDQTPFIVCDCVTFHPFYSIQILLLDYTLLKKLRVILKDWQTLAKIDWAVTEMIEIQLWVLISWIMWFFF